MRLCVGCGESLSGQRQKWCSGRCRLAYIRRETPYGDQDRERQRVAFREGPSVLLTCRSGYVFEHTRLARYPKWCDEHRPAWHNRPDEQRHHATPRSCEQCKTTFIAIQPDHRFCSPRCKNRAYKRDRSNRRFPRFQPRQRELIFARDEGRCGICRGVIDPALRFPHPRSLSIDHIDPEGEHVPDNWQASHLRCNILKRDRRVAA